MDWHTGWRCSTNTFALHHYSLHKLGNAGWTLKLLIGSIVLPPSPSTCPFDSFFFKYFKVHKKNIFIDKITVEDLKLVLQLRLLSLYMYRDI